MKQEEQSDWKVFGMSVDIQRDVVGDTRECDILNSLINVDP